MANVVAKPRKWKNKAILIKVENTVGTDAVPDGAADWIEARNVEFTPFDVTTVDRQIEKPFMGNGGTLPTGFYATLSFSAAVVGPGVAGDIPKISPVLQACGLAETVDAGTSVIYNLASQSNTAVTIYINIDGVLHKMLGARGTLTLTMERQGIPMYRFEYQSAYVAPVDQSPPTVDMTGWPVEQPVGSKTTSGLIVSGGSLAVPFTLAYSTMSFTQANQLTRIDLPGPQVEVAITDRQPTCTATVLSPEGLAGFDPFALAQAGENLTFTTTQDINRAGYKVQADIKGTITGAAYASGGIDGLLAYELTITPTPVDGDDEFALTYL